jgi:hypothetical protein
MFIFLEVIHRPQVSITLILILSMVIPMPASSGDESRLGKNGRIDRAHNGFL